MSAGPGGDPMGGYGYQYGPPSMMHPPHHMGHHGGHGMGGGHRGGGGGVVPFRAGDWKCGSEGCGYHNFAKNVSCLRCGASRAGAAVVADSAFPSPMDAPSNYGMGPGSMASTPGPGPFAAAAGGFGSGGAFGGQFGGPPSSYALPSGLGAPTGPYPPMGGGYGSNAPSHSGGAFGNPAAEAAFTSAGMGGPSGHASNGGFYGHQQQQPQQQQQQQQHEGGSDPFAFLSSGLGGLTMNDDGRRNGANTNKSPA